MKKNCILSEIRLLWHAKIIKLIIFLIFIASFVTIFFNFQYTKELSVDYNKVVDYYKDNNLDIEVDMNKSYNISENNGIMNLDNPLAYYYNQLSTAVFSTKPIYSSSLLSESAMFLFPTIFGILGLIVGTIEHKNKTMKYKVTRIGKDNYVLSKIISISIINALSIITYFIIGKIFSIIIYSNVKNIINVDSLIMVNESLNTSILTKILFILSISMIYSMIGVLFGELFKNTLFGGIVIVIYSIPMPLLARFDLKNSYYNLARVICDQRGMISFTGIKDTSVVMSVIVMGIILITTIVIYFLLIKKRSAFES